MHLVSSVLAEVAYVQLYNCPNYTDSRLVFHSSKDFESRNLFSTYSRSPKCKDAMVGLKETA